MSDTQKKLHLLALLLVNGLDCVYVLNDQDSAIRIDKPFRIYLVYSHVFESGLFVVDLLLNKCYMLKIGRIYFCVIIIMFFLDFRFLFHGITT